jgi:hypothetical protein
VVTDDGSTVRKREVEGSSRFLVDDEVWVFCVEHGGAECGDERDGGLGGALNGHRGGLLRSRPWRKSNEVLGP